MDEIERYVFDTQGCLVIPDVLSQDEVRRLVAGIPRDDGGKVVSEDDGVTFRGLLDYEEPLYRELIAHPRIVPYLRALLCSVDEPEAGHFQLSHEYGLAMRVGQQGPSFHGGGTPYRRWIGYQVQEGQVYCALIGVVWLLTDVGPDDGGFWYIPGSHKAEFPLPEAVRIYAQVPSCVVQPTARAGSAFIFTEALTHGTRPWIAAHQRLALFYKYVPGLMAHVRPVPGRALNNEQRARLEPNRLRPG
jgi:hypothetical protein